MLAEIPIAEREVQFARKVLEPLRGQYQSHEEIISVLEIARALILSDMATTDVAFGEESRKRAAKETRRSEERRKVGLPA